MRKYSYIRHMRILIDTEKKVITLQEAVNFCELYKFLKQLFPTDYKEWKVEAQPQIQWVYPNYYPNVCVGHDTIPCSFTTTSGDDGTVPQSVIEDTQANPQNYVISHVAGLGFYTEAYGNTIN